MKNCVIGIDGGGTKTRAVAVACDDGAVLGEGVSGPCSLSALSAPEALSAVHAASVAALHAAGAAREQVQALCVGVAGWSQAERRQVFEQQLGEAFPAIPLAVVPDYHVALTGAARGQPGVIVIAGTGSVAFGENADGQTHKAGAYGYLIDDAGSGYGVGRSLLRAVMQAEDGTGPATALTHCLFQALGFTSIAQIVPAVYGGFLDRLAIAALAPIVAAAANDDNDSVAQAILSRAGGALARLTEAVTSRLFQGDSQSLPIAMVGSLWNAGPWMTDVFQRSLARFSPTAVAGPPLLPPERGAALRALSLSKGLFAQQEIASGILLAGNKHAAL